MERHIEEIPISHDSELPGSSEPVTPRSQLDTDKQLEENYDPFSGHVNPHLPADFGNGADVRSALASMMSRRVTFRFETHPFFAQKRKRCSKKCLWRSIFFILLMVVVVLTITYAVLRFAPGMRWEPVKVLRTGPGNDVQRLYLYSEAGAMMALFLLQPESGQFVYTSSGPTVYSNGSYAYAVSSTDTLLVTSPLHDFAQWLPGTWLALPDGWRCRDSTGAGVRIQGPLVNLSLLQLTESSISRSGGDIVPCHQLESWLHALLPTPPAVARMRDCANISIPMLNDTLYVCSGLVADHSAPREALPCIVQVARAKNMLFTAIFETCRTRPDFWVCASQAYFDVQSQYLMSACVRDSVNATFSFPQHSFPCGAEVECRGLSGVQSCSLSLKLCPLTLERQGHTRYERLADFLSEYPDETFFGL
jgi:hypothetical protein